MNVKLVQGLGSFLPHSSILGVPLFIKGLVVDYEENMSYCHS